MNKRNWVGHNEEGITDMLYIVSVRDNSDATFTVFGKWGRRGHICPSQTKVYLTTASESAAYAEKEREVIHQTKRGYVDIKSKSYLGPVKMSDKCVQGNLEFSDKFLVSVMKNRTPSKSVALPKTGDFIVICRDNAGIEELFDSGIEYVAERHDDVNMIWVYDKLGEKREYFRERFLLVPATGKSESREAEQNGILKSFKHWSDV